MGYRLRAGIPSRYVKSQLGELSLASLRGRLIEYQLRLGYVTSAGWQVTLCDPMWHVSSRSGVATLRTAIHLLLTYLLKVKLNGVYQFATRLSATGTHVPHGITRCYLPPGRADIPALTPTEAGTRLSDPGGM